VLDTGYQGAKPRLAFWYDQVLRSHRASAFGWLPDWSNFSQRQFKTQEVVDAVLEWSQLTS